MTRSQFQGLQDFENATAEVSGNSVFLSPFRHRASNFHLRRPPTHTKHLLPNAVLCCRPQGLTTLRRQKHSEEGPERRFRVAPLHVVDGWLLRLNFAVSVCQRFLIEDRA